MRGFAIVLACLALTGHGRRVQSIPQATAHNADLRASAQQAPEDREEALAKVLFAFNPEAAWNTMSATHQHGAHELRASSRKPVEMMVKLDRPSVAPRVHTLRGGSAVMQEAAAGTETFEFQAEVAKVMDIIINSLYSDKDIFLRELVSNAADACDKRRFLSLTGDSAQVGYKGVIKIKADKEAKTLSIEDTGVGMTRKELQENLGRIAQSGTKKFAEALGDSASDDTSLIGQFGVGFYSAFLVADKVTVISKAADGPQLRWESESANKYSISADDSEPIESSGTRIVLSLKEDAEKYLDDFNLRNLLKRYSEFIQFPIELWSEKTEYDQVPDPENSVEGEPPKTKTVPRTTNVWEKVNVATPIWLRSEKEVKKEEYTEFYKTSFKQYDEPMAKIQFGLEGQVEFKALLFIPGSVPWELTQDMFNENIKPMKLYVKRVFISDKFSGDLLPRWLTFLKGIVDSDDLPLNVSRELLQKSRILSIIRKRLVRKSLDMIAGLKKDEKEFEKFSNNFGKYIKVGVIEDKDNKDALLKIAAFTSSESDKIMTLPDYVKRMKEGQKKIYYVAGTSKAAVQSSPVLEGLRKQGFEIIYALDQIDEIALQGVGTFMEHDVVDAAKGDVEEADISDEAKNATEAVKEELKSTTEFIKSALGKKVADVIVSSRLTESPSALTQPKWGMSPTMQKFMKAQAVAQGMDDPQMPNSAANLEINPDHAVVKKLKAMIAADGSTAKQYANLLYDVAAVSSGYEIEDTGSFSQRVIALMGGGDQALGALQEEKAAETPAPETPAATETATAGSTPEEDKPLEPEVLDPIDPEVL